MKIATTTQNVEKVGIGVESQFQIKTTSKAFRILSDGLYSDKVSAIIRELSCNAVDAHVLAGKTQKPFIVHLPNSMNPEFKIRDFGPGLSHEDVLNVYTTYFESTKTNSNAYVGCLGLGSKSPFSYTDSFTITSIHGGKKRVYNAYINEDELPTITMLMEEDTTEENGLEVCLGVKSVDFHNFKEKAVGIYYHFKHKPEIKGVSNITIPVKKYERTGKGWGIKTYDNYSYNNDANAIMGNVCYNLRNFPDTLSSDLEEVLLHLPIDIEFKIGELDVSASRESLSYNKQTLKAVHARLAEIGKELREDVEKEMKSCKTLWDARCKVAEFSSGYVGKIVGCQSVRKSLTWNGKSIGDANPGISDGILPSISIEKFMRVSHRYSTEPKISREFVRHLHASSKSVFFFEDEPKRSTARCKQLMKERVVIPNRGSEYKYEHVYLIKFDPLKTKATFEKDYQVLLDTFGMGYQHITNISEVVLDKKERGAYEVKPKNLLKILVFNKTAPYNKYDSSSYWDQPDEDFDKTEGGIYVPIERYNINGEDAKEEIDKRMELLKMFGISADFDIYGVKSSLLEEMANDKGWQDFKEFMIEEVSEKLKEKKYIDEMETIKTLVDYVQSIGTSINEFVKKMVKVNPKDDQKTFGKIRKLVEGLDTKNQEAVKEKMHHLAHYGLESAIKINKDLLSSLEELYKVYPMLKYVRWFKNYYGDDVSKKDVEQYINTVDSVI